MNGAMKIIIRRMVKRAIIMRVDYSVLYSITYDWPRPPIIPECKITRHFVAGCWCCRLQVATESEKWAAERWSRWHRRFKTATMRRACGWPLGLPLRTSRTLYEHCRDRAV